LPEARAGIESDTPSDVFRMPSLRHKERFDPMQAPSQRSAVGNLNFWLCWRATHSHITLFAISPESRRRAVN
jgi:hypothetical protein